MYKFVLSLFEDVFYFFSQLNPLFLFSICIFNNFFLFFYCWQNNRSLKILLTIDIWLS